MPVYNEIHNFHDTLVYGHLAQTSIRPQDTSPTYESVRPHIRINSPTYKFILHTHIPCHVHRSLYIVGVFIYHHYHLILLQKRIMPQARTTLWDENERGDKELKKKLLINNTYMQDSAAHWAIEMSTRFQQLI